MPSGCSVGTRVGPRWPSPPWPWASAPLLRYLVSPMDFCSRSCRFASGYWKRRFGMDPSIIGKPVTINRVPSVVVGVVPSERGDLGRVGDPCPDVFVPLRMEPLLSGEGNSRLHESWAWWLLILGRLKPGRHPGRVEANFGAAFRETGLEGCEAMILFAGGVVIGLGASMAATRLLKRVLFGLSPTDPATIAGAGLTLLLAAALAGYFPAGRASRVDPQVALRHE